jgi:hypothetical protein
MTPQAAPRQAKPDTVLNYFYENEQGFYYGAVILMIVQYAYRCRNEGKVAENSA